MANTKSAAKRARQTTKRALRNRRVLSRLRGSYKRHATAPATIESTRGLISEIDKAAKRGIIHKNAAKRRKARLQKALAAKPAV